MATALFIQSMKAWAHDAGNYPLTEKSPNCTPIPNRSMHQWYPLLFSNQSMALMMLRLARLIHRGFGTALSFRNTNNLPRIHLSPGCDSHYPTISPTDDGISFTAPKGKKQTPGVVNFVRQPSANSEQSWLLIPNKYPPWRGILEFFKVIKSGNIQRLSYLKFVWMSYQFLRIKNSHCLFICFEKVNLSTAPEWQYFTVRECEDFWERVRKETAGQSFAACLPFCQEGQHPCRGAKGHLVFHGLLEPQLIFTVSLEPRALWPL